MSGRVELAVPVEVDAPAAVVWDYVTDWERQGEWMLGTRVRVTGPPTTPPRGAPTPHRISTTRECDERAGERIGVTAPAR